MMHLVWPDRRAGEVPALPSQYPSLPYPWEAVEEVPGPDTLLRHSSRICVTRRSLPPCNAPNCE